MTAAGPDTPLSLETYDFSAEKAEILGVRLFKNGFSLDFFNREVFLSPGDIRPLDNLDLTPAIRDVLAAYLIHCPRQLPQVPPRPITFREFSGAAPLFSSFTMNTAKTIERHFSGKTTALTERVRDLGAIIHGRKAVTPCFHDLSVEFTPLPRISITLNFNDRDDIMPASASFLYPDTAIHFLNLKHLMTIATWLTGYLIQK